MNLEDGGAPRGSEAAVDAATQVAGIKATKAQADKAVKAVAKTMVAQEAV